MVTRAYVSGKTPGSAAYALVERCAEEKPQRLHRRVGTGSAKRTNNQMQADPAQVLNISRLSRASEKSGKDFTRRM